MVTFGRSRSGDACWQHSCMTDTGTKWGDTTWLTNQGCSSCFTASNVDWRWNDSLMSRSRNSEVSDGRPHSAYPEEEAEEDVCRQSVRHISRRVSIVQSRLPGELRVYGLCCTRPSSPCTVPGGCLVVLFPRGRGSRTLPRGCCSVDPTLYRGDPCILHSGNVRPSLLSLPGCRCGGIHRPLLPR
jgi:hypothetical protein